MRPDGTILGRKFINFPSDKDRMYRVLGRIRRFQREHGSRQVQGRWAYAKRLNTELGRKIAKGNRSVCIRKEGRCDCFRISGNERKTFREEKSRNCRCGENVISRNGADSRHIERESEFPGFVPGTRAGLPLTDQERLPVIHGIIVCVNVSDWKKIQL